MFLDVMNKFYYNAGFSTVPSAFILGILSVSQCMDL
jgi:hypothetical protein